MTDVKQKDAGLRKARRRENLIALAMLAPYIIIFVIFTLVPVIMGVVYSFMDYDPSFTEGNKFVGLGNYIKLFDLSKTFSKEFWESFSTMLLFDLVAIPCLIFIPLLLAYFINMRPPGYKVFRALIYLPSVISISIMGIIFSRMFAGDEFGLINSWLNTKIDWLGGRPWQGDTLRWLIMLIASIWWQTGSNFVIFSGALRNVPKSLLEACEMDGGKRFKKFIYVTFPNIKPSLSICMFNTLIGYLSLYGQTIALCTSENESINVAPMMFIQNMIINRSDLTGFISACAIVFGLIVMVLGAVQRKCMSEDNRRNTRHTADCERYRATKNHFGLTSIETAPVAATANYVTTGYTTATRATKPDKPLKVRGKLSKSELTARREKTVAFVVLFIVSVLFVFPLLYMLGTSFKTPYDIRNHPERIFPSPGQWTINNYSTFIINEGKLDQLPVWILNSLWSSFASVGLTVLMDLVVAFAVVFLQFKGKNTFIKFLTLWMAIPGVIGNAPAYAMFVSMRKLLGATTGAGGYLYAYFWLIIPGITGIFNMLLMRNFFASIPKDIVESAKSDGAGIMTIFRRIVVPLAKSTIMLIVLFSFVGAWNNLIWPQLIFSTAENKMWYTITLGLITDMHATNAAEYVGMQMASGIFSLIPIIIIFAITQNKMIDGLASTGVKM